MWMSAVDFRSSQRDHTGHGEPPEPPDWAAINGDQWFDLDTGRSWMWMHIDDAEYERLRAQIYDGKEETT